MILHYVKYGIIHILFMSYIATKKDVANKTTSFSYRKGT